MSDEPITEATPEVSPEVAQGPVDVAQLDTAQRGHHPDSPSSLQASEACPLFENEQRDSQASKDGVLQHKAAETRDLTILDGNESWIGAVQRCIELEDLAIASLTDGESFPTVVREVRLSVGDDIVVGEDGVVWPGVTAGFPDTLIVSWDGKSAIILDYKFGKIPVTPTRNNLQGKAYALAALEKYPQLEDVTVVFFAPHQMWSDEEQQGKYVHVFTRADMPAMENRIRTVIKRKHEAKAALEASGGRDWSAAQPRHDLCVWCNLKGRCTKNLELVIQAGVKHELAAIPPQFTAIEISTPEQVAAAYKTVAHLEPILKAIKKRCTELALTQDNMLPENWKIVRRQDREITSLEAVVEAAKRHGVKKKELETIYTIPISKVEALIKSKAEKGLGAAAVRGFSETLEELGAVKLGPPVHFLQEVKTPAEKSHVETTSIEAPINI